MQQDKDGNTKDYDDTLYLLYYFDSHLSQNYIRLDDIFSET